MNRVDQETRPLDAPGFDLLCSSVDDVPQGDAHRLCDRVRHPVHGVGAQNDEVRSVLFDPACRPREGRGRLFPPALMLEPLDGSEVDAVHQSIGRMMAAKSLFDRLVDHPIVDGQGLQTHPADLAGSAHRKIRLKLEGPSFTLTGSHL